MSGRAGQRVPRDVQETLSDRSRTAEVLVMGEVGSIVAVCCHSFSETRREKNFGFRQRRV